MKIVILCFILGFILIPCGFYNIQKYSIEKRKFAKLFFKSGKLLTQPEKGCLEKVEGKYYYTDMDGIRREIKFYIWRA